MPNGYDLPGGFMSEHDWLRGDERADASMAKVMHIGPAYADGCHADDDISIPRHGFRPVPHRHDPRCFQDSSSIRA